MTNVEMDENTSARNSLVKNVANSSPEIASHHSSVPDLCSQFEIIVPHVTSPHEFTTPDESINSCNSMNARILHSPSSSPSTSPHNSGELVHIPTSSLYGSNSPGYNEELPTESIRSVEHPNEHPPLLNNLQVVKFPTLPTETKILEDFEEWSLSMDGACQAPGIAYRSKLIMKNAIQSIGLQSMMQPKTVCQYFTGNNNITAATTNVYLRYLSNFLLFVHEEYPKVFTSEDHQVMRNRISR